jgi:hypothetical protein
MFRRLLTLLAALLLLTGAAGCSSSSKDEEGAATTTTEEKQEKDEEKTTRTTEAEEDEEESPATTGRTRARIDLGSLRPGSSDGGSTDRGSSEEDSPFSAADEECVNDGIADDPYLSEYASYDEITSQADREAFWNIVIDCVGTTPLIDLFMEGFREGAPDLTATQYACVEDEVGLLTQSELVALLSEDPDMTDELTSDIIANCSLV